MDNIKLKTFEYIVYNLFNWYCENNNADDNDLRLQKIFNLLFFVTAISTTEKIKGLLIVFNKFHATAFGNIEKDIYENKDKSKYLKISRSPLKIDKFPDDYFNDGGFKIYKDLVDKSIGKLKGVNYKLINYNTFDLISLNYLWSSCSSMLNLAKSLNKSNVKIPYDMIQKENKIYKLYFE